MTITDPRLLGGSATGLADRPASAGDQQPRPATGEDRDMHLLRLSLDLQLDALLLVLGAAAAGRPEAGIPWRRWLDEDVELAWELTTTALAVNAALPPTLGTDLAHAAPESLADDLRVRYESMRGLLADLLSRDAGDGPAWHSHVREALGRCEKRLAEMHAQRDQQRASTPDQEPPLDRVHRAPAHHPRAPSSYLPGELLG